MPRLSVQRRRLVNKKRKQRALPTKQKEKKTFFICPEYFFLLCPDRRGRYPEEADDCLAVKG
jgi:hypothetical protein